MDERLRQLLNALNGEALNLGLPTAATLAMLEANVDLILRYQVALSNSEMAQRAKPAATPRSRARETSPTA